MSTKKTIRLCGTIAVLSFLLVVTAPETNASAPASAIKVLIITGQHNHNWKASSANLERILDESGLFEADIAVSPPKGEKMAGFSVDFARYQLVILDYNGDDWPDPMKKAFVDFVRSGGGVVVYHGADNAFPRWPEYNRIIGLGFGGNRDEKSGPYVFWDRGKQVQDTSKGIGGYHGDQHAFLVVNRDLSHPVTNGLPEKWMHATDELYSLLRGPGENIHILATAYSDPATRGSGRDEPVLFTVGYGEGRVFHTVLGHVMGDGPMPSIQCVGFIVTFLRGAEWAATGKVTQKIPGDFPAVYRNAGTPDDIRLWPDYRPPDLEKILAVAAAYDYGKDEEVLSQLHDYVRARMNSPQARRECEKKLMDFLGTDATLASKRKVCQHLREIGSAVSVPALSEILGTAETSDMARYALEKIPGDEAEKVLLEGLLRSEGAVRLGIIDSLGNRKARSAVPYLAEILSGKDEEAAVASAESLGKIASPGAVSVLSEAMPQTSAGLKTRIASSLLRCAEVLLSEKETASAAGIYRNLVQKDLPLPVRQAAMRGRIASSGDKARKMITEALEADDQDWYAPAIAMVEKFYDSSTIQEICFLLPDLPAEYQVQLLGVLSRFREEGVRSSLLSAAENPDIRIRVAALEALAKVGNYTAIESLVSHAAHSGGKEQQAARNSLGRLKCGLATRTILTSLVKSGDDAIRFELIMIIGERRIKEGLNLLLGIVRNSTGRNRRQAIRSLEKIASPSDLPQMVRLLLAVKEVEDQLELASTIAAVAARSLQPVGKSSAVVAELSSAVDVKGRCALYRTLGKIGDDSSLPLLRKALADEDQAVKDAAVRALAEWPSASAKEDLLRIAKTSEAPVHRVLALQAYIRMMEMEPFQSPENAVRSLENVMAMARTEEKKLILGVLPTFASSQALELARRLLQDKEVEAEARLAIQKIEEILKK